MEQDKSEESKNETESKNRGPEAGFPTPPSDSPKNRFEENQMSTQEYFPRKNSLLTGDTGSPTIYVEHIDSTDSNINGFDKKSEKSSPLLSSLNIAQNKTIGPPGLAKTSSDEMNFGVRRMSTPNHLLESVQRNTSSSQEPAWAPENRVLSQFLQGKEKSPDSKIPNLLPKFLEDGLDSPPPRTHRSFSFSVGHSLGGIVGDSKGNDGKGFLTPNMMNGDKNASKFEGLLSRSKSISYDSSSQGEEGDIFEGFSALSLNQRASIPTSDIWNPNPNEPVRTSFTPLYHRRASTQPALAPGWGDIGEVMDPVVNDGNVMMSQEQIERYREQRKFTHAPSLMTEYIQRFNMSRGSELKLENPYESNVRRHSVSSPLLDARGALNDQSSSVSQMRRKDAGDSVSPPFEGINEYFENTEIRAKAWAQAGKNLQAISSRVSDRTSASTVEPNSVSCNWPIYVVEFKAGRTDFFYVSEGLQVRIGDLVIVEADRGKDLGKVVQTSINSMEELIQFKEKIQAKMPELYNGNTAIVPKCIYRLAQPSETSMLFIKSEDEQRAMASCQQKILDRKLPMEIVDTEYQWDRRKLTFYFVSDSRIDFRELVRELFKVYKTRIWMCAVNINTGGL